MASSIHRPRNPTSGNFSPLMRAAAIGHSGLVQALLEQGVDVNEKGPRDSTALMFAAGGGHLEIVKMLVEKGADLDAKEAGGWCALAHAAADGHRDIVEFLMRSRRS